MSFNFQRPFRLIEKLFPGALSASSSPEPNAVDNTIIPIWPAFAVREIESSIRVDALGPTAPGAGTNTFTFATAGRDRVLIPLLVRVLHDNGAARNVEVRIVANGVTPTDLAQNPWIRWQTPGFVAPPLSMDIQLVAASFTTTLRTQIPFIPEGNTLTVNFLGMTAAVGTMAADFYFLDAPRSILELSVDARSGSG